MTDFFRGRLLSTLLGGLLAAGAPALQAQTLNSVRLLPLGDSITAGYLSSTGDGYRGPLWDTLSGQISFVDFVGTQHGGSMSDPNEEGHYGWYITQIAGIATGVLQTFRPNVVTLHIGTNDLNGGRDVDAAPARLASLIDQIVAAAPDATVLVATLITAENSTTASRIAVYNAQIPGIVQQRANAGKHVRVVDMSHITTADLKDGLHPNDTGYAKMAAAWDSGVAAAVKSNWIHEPVNVAAIPGNGVHHLHPRSAPDLALDDFGNHLNSGNPIDAWTDNDSGAQKWNFSDANVSPSGAFKISLAAGPYCLTATGTTSESAVELRECSGSAGQAWKTEPAIGGYILHPASNPKLCLDERAASTDKGTQVWAYACNNTNAQRWIFD